VVFQIGEEFVRKNCSPNSEQGGGWKLKKSLIVLAAAVVAILGTATSAMASGVIDWGGHGSDVLPCDSGGHWVLAPSFGVDSATLTVNGADYVMTQNGNGSWSADSSGLLDANLTASVAYAGDGDERDSLQLSHCTTVDSPSPTESPSPSSSPSTTVSPSTTPTSTEADPTPSKNLAFTGMNMTTPLLWIGGLILVGLSLLFWARRKV
jgi:LPXTG-motif cell wall-anchored protein